jgi:hypothetical protein
MKKKVLKKAKDGVAVSDATSVSRKPSSKLLGDKPNYSRFEKNPVQGGFAQTGSGGKKDSTDYATGFAEQVMKNKLAGKTTSNSGALNPYRTLGREEANERRNSGTLKKEAMKSGGMIKRADGSYSKRGLWDNIRANKGSGKKPTAAMLKQEKKIKAQTKKK